VTAHAHDDVDCFVVETAQLAVVLHRYAASRPHQATSSLIAEQAQIPKGTLDNLLYRDPVTKQPAPRRRVTSLRIADSILVAIDRTELLYDGTLEPMPNPAIAARNWTDCCGGSLTGVA
jgi:hypothetical protein